MINVEVVEEDLISESFSAKASGEGTGSQQDHGFVDVFLIYKNYWT